MASIGALHQPGIEEEKEPSQEEEDSVALTKRASEHGAEEEDGMRTGETLTARLSRKEARKARSLVSMNH